MKSRIFMYLFIFSVLLIIFQYANSKRILDKYEKDIIKYKGKLRESDSLINVLQDEKFDLALFQIEGNDDAIDYFEAQGFDTDQLIPLIKDGLYSKNDYDGDQHPIIPFVALNNSKMLINNIRILNHKWIIANFTDSDYWGEIFITYDIDDKGILTYNPKEYFLYPKL